MDGLFYDLIDTFERTKLLDALPGRSSYTLLSHRYTRVRLPFSGPPYSITNIRHTPESFMAAVDLSGNGDLSAKEIEIALKDFGLDGDPETEAFLGSLDQEKQYLLMDLRKDLWSKILRLVFLKAFA